MLHRSIDTDILGYIIHYFRENGYAPSIREIQSEFGFRSTSTVAYHLKKLQDDKLVYRENKINRGLTTIYTHNKSSHSNRLQKYNNLGLGKIPLIGEITAGQPILAQENYQETYFIPTSLFRGENLFMLNVHGTSMINAGINDGDKIILKQQSTAENGEIIAALIDGSATVKRFYKEDGHYRLQPENPTMKPIICDDVQILGKVIGLIRKF